MEKLKEKYTAIFRSRGILGCCTNSADEPSKRHRFQGQREKKQSITEDFWSSSTTYEMDNNAFPSQRSVSSVCTSSTHNNLHPHNNSSSSSNPPEFVNHGLLLWNQTRQRWVGEEESKKLKQAQESKLCWNATYESLLGTTKPFPDPIPLPEMVDFLVDIWMQEGLYD